MAGSLIKLEEVNVTSAVASVTLGDDKWDTSYDVYMVKVMNCTPDADGVGLHFRFTESGTPNTTTNYDYALKNLRTAAGFSNGSGTSNKGIVTGGATGSATNETANSIMYIFNANNSSEYTFTTIEGVILSSASAELRGGQGGNVFTVTSAVDGIQIFFDGGNIESATFTLYGLAK